LREKETFANSALLPTHILILLTIDGVCFINYHLYKVHIIMSANPRLDDSRQVRPSKPRYTNRKLIDEDTNNNPDNYFEDNNQFGDLFEGNTNQKFNDPKKNKNNMNRSNNDRISQREFDEAEINHNRYKNRLNIDRIMLERQMTQHNFENDDDKYVGEVTGEEFDGSEFYDKGMPIRSSYTVKRSRYDDNSHLDFDLYQKIDKHNMDKISYSESTGNNDYANLDEAMKTITRGVDPYETCISDVNATTCWLYSNMYVFSKDDFVVNGFGLFSGFGVIYLISQANTEIELKNYFTFQDKKHLNAGLLTIRESLNKQRNQVSIDNYLINDKNIPSNMNVSRKLKSLIFNIVINRDYPDEEADRVNKIVKTISMMDDVVSANTLSKSDISLISLAKISPIWAYKIENIVKARFHNNVEGVLDFIRFLGKTFDYYEDAEKQLIEIPLYGDVFSIGLILSKNNKQSTLTELKSLSVAINYFKPTVLDEVLIPIIKKRFKMRMNKTLQKTGLNLVFTEEELVGLFPEKGTINDCIQYVDIDFGTKTANKRCDNKGYRTTRKFIANREFEFYLRNIQTNCIMIMGRI
jgi:serine protease inhibitor